MDSPGLLMDFFFPAGLFMKLITELRKCHFTVSYFLISKFDLLSDLTDLSFGPVYSSVHDK